MILLSGMESPSGLAANDTLAEVLDGHGRPICLMRPEDIIEQKLRHRAAALLICDEKGRQLLAQSADGLGFTAYAALPAQSSLEDFARGMAERIGDMAALRPRLIGVIPPGQPTANGEVYIFRAHVKALLAEQMLRNGELLADRVEILGLMEAGYTFSPVYIDAFRRFFDK